MLDPVTKGALKSSYSHLQEKNSQKKKNVLHSASKFFQLSCPIEVGIHLSNRFVYPPIEDVDSKKKIPVLKKWFEALPVQERVLCLSTIDSEIVGYLKKMQQTIR